MTTSIQLSKQRRKPAAIPPIAVVPGNKFCTCVRFVLHDGSILFPTRLKNRQTGKFAFRLSKGGLEGNMLRNSIEIEDEGEMIDLACKRGLAVRLSSANGERKGLYRKDGHSVRHVELNGLVI